MIGILEIDNFFSPEECEEAIKLINELGAEQSSIMEMSEAARKYSERLLPRLPKTFEIEEGIIEITGIADKITFCKQDKAIEKHTDKKFSPDNYLKLCIFLNRTSLDGGLIFDKYYVPIATGKAVIFDMSYSHEGEKFPKAEWKFVLGFRILGTKKSNE